MEGPAALRPRLLCSCTVRREGPALTPSVVCFPPSDLEDFVDDLKKDSTSASRVVTLKDVEDGAFLLRQVGEAVASLKGEHPPWSRRGIQTTHQTVKDSFVHVGRCSSNTHRALFWVLKMHP